MKPIIITCRRKKCEPPLMYDIYKDDKIWLTDARARAMACVLCKSAKIKEAK